jgi:hypothetical protein
LAKKPKKREIVEPIALKKAPRESLVWSCLGKNGMAAGRHPQRSQSLVRTVAIGGVFGMFAAAKKGGFAFCGCEGQR